MNLKIFAWLNMLSYILFESNVEYVVCLGVDLLQ